MSRTRKNIREVWFSDTLSQNTELVYVYFFTSCLFARDEQGTTSSRVFKSPKTKGADRLDEQNVVVKQK